MRLNVEFEHRASRQVGKQNCGAWTAVFIDNLEDVWGLRRDFEKSERKEVREV